MSPWEPQAGGNGGSQPDVLDFRGDLSRTREVLDFVKSDANPLFTVAMTNGDFASLYWPSVLRVDGILTAPLGRYYKWFSTNHSAGAGGIGLAHADLREGPWSYHGIVYVDTGSGLGSYQTETPQVLWNEATGLLHLYYKQLAVVGAVSPGSGMLATSPDGIAWTRYAGNPVLDYASSSAWPKGSWSGTGDHLLGYIKPFRLGGRWYCVSLGAGGDEPHELLWYSSDGRAWIRDRRPLGYNADLVPAGYSYGGPARPFVHRGQLWAVGQVGDFVSGGHPTDAYPAVWRIAPNLRQPLSPPIPIGGAAQAWETTNYDVGSLLLDDDGTLSYYYMNNGQIGVMTADVR